MTKNTASGLVLMSIT